jgi:hypothetical protein
LPDHVIVFGNLVGEFRTNVATSGSCDCVFGGIWVFCSLGSVTLHSLALSIQCVYVFYTRELRYAIRSNGPLTIFWLMHVD